MGRFVKPIKVFTAVFMAAVTVSSYSLNVGATNSEGKVTVSLLGKYDSSDTAAIREIDTDNKIIRFRNHSTGKNYTLTYDNTSLMYDLMGVPMSPRLLEVGQIVDVNFLKSTKHVTSLKVSDKAWTIEETRNHELVRGDGTAKIKGDLYKLDARTLIMADGAPAIAEDILTTDNIKAYGIDREIYSIVVTSGHGYVSLSSDTVDDQSLVGAWIELDNDVIYKISPNMLLSAPEGDYNLQIIGNGANYSSKVNISRNKETVVDTTNVKITKPKEGLVTFEITPDTAEVFVDDEKVLTDTPQSIRYGYHNLKIMAEGYITQNKYLKVGTPDSVVKIELEKDTDADSSASSSSYSSNYDASLGKTNKSSSAVSVATLPEKSASAASASTAADKNKDAVRKNKVIEGYKVYVNEPSGAELYFDGNYIGVIPTSFTKISGSHEIILKKDDYRTKSYRVNIDSDEVDVNYEFPEMIKEKHESEEDKDEKPSDAAKDKSVNNSSSSVTTEEASEAPFAASASTVTKEGEEGSTAGTSDEDNKETSAGASTSGKGKPKNDTTPPEANPPKEKESAASTASGEDLDET
ncbi:MAG: PEGA domain-containing protein [Butyrivibrio sp.]|nr:PEGA domain-containing protein [Butyrivibrio sp.]